LPFDYSFQSFSYSYPYLLSFSSVIVNHAYSTFSMFRIISFFVYYKTKGCYLLKKFIFILITTIQFQKLYKRNLDDSHRLITMKFLLPFEKQTTYHIS